MNTQQVLWRGVSCIGHTLVQMYRVCMQQTHNMEMTGVCKCAMAFWSLNHEQFSAFQRLWHTESLSLFLSPSLSFLLSLSCKHTQTPTLTHTHTHSCHRGPLAPLLTVCLAFRFTDRRPPVRTGTGMTLAHLLSSQRQVERHKKKRYCTTNTVWGESRQTHTHTHTLI